MSQPVELSLEQKFSIRSFEQQVSKMSHNQAKDFLVKLFEQMMVKEALYASMLKKNWGLEPKPETEGDIDSANDILDR